MNATLRLHVLASVKVFMFSELNTNIAQKTKHD